MDPRLIALWLMAAQDCLGAFDTLFHHELTVALPRRDTAVRELRIHSLRAMIYAVLFVVVACWVPTGWPALLLFAVFGVEIVLTLWDFVVEDRTRLLPATERVVHTVLAMNGGAFIALLALNLPALALSAGGPCMAAGWLSFGVPGRLRRGCRHLQPARPVRGPQPGTEARTGSPE